MLKNEEYGKESIREDSSPLPPNHPLGGRKEPYYGHSVRWKRDDHTCMRERERVVKEYQAACCPCGTISQQRERERVVKEYHAACCPCGTISQQRERERENYRGGPDVKCETVFRDWDTGLKGLRTSGSKIHRI